MGGELVEGGVDARINGALRAARVVSFLAEDKPARGAAIDAV